LLVSLNIFARTNCCLYIDLDTEWKCFPAEKVRHEFGKNCSIVKYFWTHIKNWAIVTWKKCIYFKKLYFFHVYVPFHTTIAKCSYLINKWHEIRSFFSPGLNIENNIFHTLECILIEELALKWMLINTTKQHKLGMKRGHGCSSFKVVILRVRINATNFKNSCYCCCCCNMGIYKDGDFSIPVLFQAIFH